MEEILKDKLLKAKQKTSIIASGLTEGTISVKELLNRAGISMPVEKAICLESIEYVTKNNPGILDEESFRYVIKLVADSSPRIKLESSRIIANTAHHHNSNLGKASEALVANANHEGTVVRWATACALGEIIKLDAELYKNLAPTIEKILVKETDNGTRKKYEDALKKAAKNFKTNSE